jgi:hypothetical protein
MKTIFGPQLLSYKGFHGCDSICGLLIVQNSAEQFVIFCVEVPGNPGTSVTNCAEHLSCGVLKKFEIPWNNFVWIEHYPARRHADEDWDMVTFTVNKETSECEQPSWRPVTDDDWSELNVGDVRGILRNINWEKIVKEHIG